MIPKPVIPKDGIEVDPDVLRLDPTDTVCWKSDDAGRFEIEFDQDSPFDRTRYGHDDCVRARSPRREADRKGYKYTVYEEGNRKNLKDPKIIVEDPT